MATISIPPVDAPHFNDKPTPIPANTPPATAFNIMSSEIDKTGKNSRNIVTNTTDNILYTVNPLPTLNQPKISTGILNKKTNFPVLNLILKKSRKILETSCAAPLKPLAYTFALIKKKLNDNATDVEPNITTAIIFASIKNTFYPPLHYSSDKTY